jgi:hypothetical protein
MFKTDKIHWLMTTSPLHKTKTKKNKKYNVMCWTPLYASKHKNVNITRDLLQTTSGKDDVFWL